MTRSTPVVHRNEVTLVGRVTSAPQVRTLPSSDDIVTWRVTVDRDPPSREPAGTRRVVDPLDCVAWTSAARRAALACRQDDVVEVTGALRRRFWQTGGGAASRCEVEVRRVRRLVRAAALPRRTVRRGAGLA